MLSWRVFKELGDDDATHLAAGVAYYAMFGLFPLILAILAIGGVLLNTTEQQEDFVNFVTDNLPGSKGFVEDNLREVIRFRSALGIAAIAGLLWSASAGMGAVARGVNRAWDVHRNRPFYVAKPLQIMMALAVGVLFLLSTFLTSAIEVITDPRRNWSLPGQDILLDMGIANLALRIAPLLINMAIFLLLYYFAPNCKTYWRYVWPGALVAAILFEIAKGIFIWYLDNLATYDQVYGSVTSVMSLLLWMWVSALILILGAEISSEYGRMKEGVDRGQLIHPLSVKE
ncbi:MAG: YihY/virulence factor BrkB family protein [Chloroflexota bacterium]|nr:YihY/virulence factor BrkB family protein [Chloroflexota bacterium]